MTFAFGFDLAKQEANEMRQRVSERRALNELPISLLLTGMASRSMYVLVARKRQWKMSAPRGDPGKAVRRDLLGRDIDRQLMIPHVAHLVRVDFLPEA